MLKRKKKTAAKAGYEINKEFPIRQIRVTNGCRYYQVDLGSIFYGKGGRKNFASAKRAHAYAAKSSKAADAGINVKPVRQHILTTNAANVEIETVEIPDPHSEALEILKPFNIDLVEAARFYTEHHDAVEYIHNTRALLEQFIADYQTDLQRISDKRDEEDPANVTEAPSLATESVENAAENEAETLQFPDMKHEALEVLNPLYEMHHAVVDHVDEAGESVDPLVAEDPVEQPVAEESVQADQAAIAGETIEPPVSEEQAQTDRDELEPVSLVDTRDVSQTWQPPYIPKNVKTQKTYTPTDVRRIMKTAKPELVPYLALGLFGGLRSTEILKLRWRDIDFDLAEIQVNAGQSKVKGSRIVHMQSNLGQFLVPFRGKAKEFVVPHKQENLQRWTRKLFNELDIKTIQQGARHSFAMYHLASHTLDETMKELGYAESAPLHRYYRGLTNRRREQAVKYFAIAPPESAEIIPLKKNRKAA